MKIAVCDDDMATREHIVTLIKELIRDTAVVTFASGEEMLKAKEDFDISFLDVKMKELSGMDVAKHIRQEQEQNGSKKSIIIFVSGYEKYMNDAFDVLAFHYLLKPIDEEKFRTVFGRALKELSVAEERTKRYILVKSSGVQQKVYVKDVYYIESANKKVIIHTGAGILESYGKMEKLEQMTGNGFYRCHRCYLVNMEKIVSYNADTIKVVNGDKLILAQKKYNDFIRHYMKYAKNGGIVNV
ncbi:MAG: response regulator transcription factor [Hungatella sp.]|jgi:DNA-binding LytR/AlgR family response regulator|nr:response regulator transcription factor [Hungatella sp.]MCI9638394.1 response regulator transcription factor [Hungatella sp.]